ncbi:MAG: hypothetical protein H6Q86_2661 [candidate division NC10 bacterium]|jgi:hypothetical protein|nr:hypothetical protein [candidate division NC10 bacterium]
MRRIILSVLTLSILVTSAPARAQHGGGESGGSGCGDLFGDLVHVLRAPVTGQPILQKAWVALKGGGYGYAYCPVPVDVSGAELPFLAPVWDDVQQRYVESCDVDPAWATEVVAVNYFGRLSGGRTKERNIRMHLDEVIANIKMAQVVSREATGRLMLGTDCTAGADGKFIVSTCSWKAVDSPQENIAVYQRVLKYGHLQTDPREIDPAAGDPNAPESHRPALDAADRAKFLPPVTTLLPDCTAPVPTDDSAWSCAQPERLTPADFGFAAGTLAAAADKTGTVTADLVQYMNRIMRVGLKTEYTVPALGLLPALYRPSPVNPDVGEVQGTLYEGSSSLPPPANERFVDFAGVTYTRTDWFNTVIPVVKPLNHLTWLYDSKVPLLKYLEFANPSWGSGSANTGITGFVRATNDSLRTTEFFHNYAVPGDLGWDFKYLR